MDAELGFEKSPLKSKKFVAYLIADIGWLAMLVLILLIFGLDEKLSFLEWSLLMGTILVKGFVQVGTILGQASLDKYTRIAKINASLGTPTDTMRKK